MIINIISTIVLLFEQILMNVKQIMEDVNKIVITMLEVTTVHVIMASVWIPMVRIAQVHKTIKLIINYTFT